MTIKISSGDLSVENKDSKHKICLVYFVAAKYRFYHSLRKSCICVNSGLFYVLSSKLCFQINLFLVITQFSSILTPRYSLQSYTHIMKGLRSQEI